MSKQMTAMESIAAPNPVTLSYQQHASLDPADVPLIGAEAIGRAIGVIKSPGEPTKSEMRRSYYACAKLKEAGVVDSFGRLLVTTPRRLHAHFGGKAA
jgi:hypothetical protein